jgi:hypothetical protein
MLRFNFMCLCTFLVLIAPFKDELVASTLYRRPESLVATTAQTKGMQKADLEIVSRLLKSYRHNANQDENRGESMWKVFFDERHKKLHQTFISATVEAAAPFFRNPSVSDLFYGFDNLTVSILPSFQNPSTQRDHATVCLDLLVRFAEAIGAICLDNPEGYNHTKPFPWKADEIIAKIMQTLGAPIAFPNPYPNEYGLQSSYGIISYRAPQALYQAYRIKKMLKGIENPRVLEIGGGLGRTAYYARALGIKDYTIVDLPFTAISSGYFLGCTLGEDQVLFSGETAHDAQQRVKIITPEEFLAGIDKYDLIVNADGFTEMDPKVARAYFKKIEDSTPTLLSINHESNSYTVKMLADESKRVVEVQRYPYWMRNGYVEEVIRMK